KVLPFQGAAFVLRRRPRLCGSARLWRRLSVLRPGSDPSVLVAGVSHGAAYSGGPRLASALSSRLPLFVYRPLPGGNLCPWLVGVQLFLAFPKPSNHCRFALFRLLCALAQRSRRVAAAQLPPRRSVRGSRGRRRIYGRPRCGLPHSVRRFHLSPA